MPGNHWSEARPRVQGSRLCKTELGARALNGMRCHGIPEPPPNFAVNIEGASIASLFTLANPFQRPDPDTDVKCLSHRCDQEWGPYIIAQYPLETAKYNLVVT